MLRRNRRKQSVFFANVSPVTLPLLLRSVLGINIWVVDTFVSAYVTPMGCGGETNQEEIESLFY